MTLQKLEAKTTAHTVRDRNVEELTDIVNDVRNASDNLGPDHAPISIIHDLMYPFCAPDPEFLHELYPIIVVYNCWVEFVEKYVSRDASPPTMKKNFYKWTRWFHPNRHPHLSFKTL